MLRTRVVTGCILGALLLLGLFLLPPLMAVLAFGAVFTIGAWEWAGFGALAQRAGQGLLRSRCCMRFCAQLAMDFRSRAFDHFAHGGLRAGG